MTRALTIRDIMTYKPKVMNFEGKWADSFGKPEISGCWLVWGNSGNGKTRFALQLCAYLTQFGRVAYDSLEEGVSLSLQRAIKSTAGLYGNKILILDKEPMKELSERLNKKKSPDIVVIDSLQYSGLNKDSVKTLIDRYSKKLFIFISHADGKNHAGRTANAVRFHANIKLFVDGYAIMNPVSRYTDGETKPFIIWEEGARRIFGNI